MPDNLRIHPSARMTPELICRELLQRIEAGEVRGLTAVIQWSDTTYSTVWANEDSGVTCQAALVLHDSVTQSLRMEDG